MSVVWRLPWKWVICACSAGGSYYFFQNNSNVLGASLATCTVILFIMNRRIARYVARTKLRTNSIHEHLLEINQASRHNPYMTKSAQELSQLIRSGQVTSEQIVAAHITHIDLVNYHLNAVVKDRFKEALEEARRADAQIAEWKLQNRDLHELPPLFGVPFTVKECFALTGMPNASGLVARREVISERDATVVERLRAAGAIPIGVTNTSELCMWFESNNSLYGRTNNPYNPTRIVGGSSGGEGSIIGSGASPFGVGSDIGGSIRMPAFFNGVFGHKPSGGLVPATGQFPIGAGLALSYLTTGPLCRKAEDLALLTELMIGPDNQDAGCVEYPTLKNLVQLKNSVDLSKLKVFYLDEIRVPLVSTIDPEMKEAVHRAVAHLRTVCQDTSDIKNSGKLKQLGDAVNIWNCMLHEGNPISFTEMMSNGQRFSAWRELIRWIITGKSPYTLPALALCLVEKLPELTPTRTANAVRAGESLLKEFEELLGDDGILIFPSHPMPAPKHRAPLLTPFNYVYTGIWNMLLAPATQVPLGLSKNNLPLGIQVISKKGNDHVTIAVAEELERAFGGWVPPSTLLSK